MPPLLLNGEALTLPDLERVARHGETVALDPAARPKVEAARRVIEDGLAAERAIYGVSTGFGPLSDVFVGAADREALQRNLVRSHAVGVGDPIGEAETRATVLLRANVLAKGHSGVRPGIVDLLCEMLNRGVHPVIPERGSVGASGDLAPLAHLALVLIGEGEARYRDDRLPGAEALQRAGLSPVTLAAKEGLALINGTCGMAGIGALALNRAEGLVRLADVAGAMTLEALRGSFVPFDPRLQAVRPHPGQAGTAENLRRLLQESEINLSHKDCGKIQDSYTLRCIPQVHGGVREVMAFAEAIHERELNSATDNPLIFPDSGDILPGGNFHGHPVALALDALAVALAGLCGFIERRIERLVNPQLSELPPFLVRASGLNSGFMVAQISAAALTAEARVLSSPASVQSIPTSGNKEDFVSMGWLAAVKAARIVAILAHVLTLEFLCAAQGLDFLRPLRPGRGVLVAYEILRRHVSHLEEDRVLRRDLDRVLPLLEGGSLLASVEAAVGTLH
ncbi:MAG TPA: histidine ammonia-lyase [Candidatus Methylomirabilis sp.]|nr:histidine ammonia-lyase [Candidatus Methylomirabilis sp.]